jgi:hypothetical protein
MNNGVIKSEVFYTDHEDVIHHKTSQPTEGLILKRNAELRKNAGAIQDLGAQSGSTWGRQLASIPFITYEWAKRNGFDLDSKDAKFAEKEMHRFLTTTVQGRDCLVQAPTEGRGTWHS